MPLNRRLLKESYVVGSQTADFLFGFPSYFTKNLSGSGAITTVDATGTRPGALKATIGTGTSDAKVLMGSLDPTKVRALTIDLIDVYSTNANPWLEFGLLNGSGTDWIMFDAGNGTTGPRLQSQSATSANRQTVNAYSHQQFTDIDLGLEIDFQKKVSQMHVDYSWVQADTAADFPQGIMSVMPFYLRSSAGVCGENSEVYVKQIKVEVYR